MKKIIFFMGSAMLVLGACNSKDTSSSSAATDSTKMSSTADMKQKMQESNKQKAIACDIAFSNHDANAVFKDATPDVIDYQDGTTPPLKGLDSARNGAAMFMKSFPDIKGENFMAIADADWVAVYGDWRATFKNDMMGMKATGKTYKWKDVDLYKFNEAGKLTEHRSIQQMGAMMK